ncbi:MAG TPA: PAS domain S-box protein [Caulobacteraceae bacterium]|nr:PAS domain S-box protein [Caulobacteraceae bacterium]
MTDSADPVLFKAIVDSVPEAIIVSTPEGEITFMNHGAERLLGYSSADVAGKSITTLVPPQPGRRADAVKWLARWAAEPQPEQSRFLDFMARRKDGAEMPVDVRVSEGLVGGQRRFFITVRDNTARRKEQIAFKEANLRAARILLVAEDAIVSCDAEQNITFFNLSAEHMFGWRAEEAIGKPLAMLLPQGARAKHPASVEAFGAGPFASRMMSERQEVQGQRRDGEVFPIEATITKVAVGGVMTYTAHLRDISARKAAQAKLAESERRFRAMFDHAVGAIALLAPDGTVLEINTAARALTTGDGALVGHKLWELPWLGAAGGDADAGRQRLKDAVTAAAQGLAVRFPAELTDGGRTRRIDLSLTPVTDEAGKVIYILPEGHEAAGSAGL